LTDVPLSIHENDGDGLRNLKKRNYSSQFGNERYLVLCQRYCACPSFAREILQLGGRAYRGAQLSKLLSKFVRHINNAKPKHRKSRSKKPAL